MMWTCEYFADFLIGEDFHTDPDKSQAFIVSLLTSKNLQELAVCIQRYCMRLMRFEFTAA